jgi:hypothetical protein
MADKDLGDALGQTTLNLPVYGSSNRKPLKNIEEDTTPVKFIDPIAAAPVREKTKGPTAGETYLSDTKASREALETGRKTLLTLESEKIIDEANRQAEKARKLSESSAKQRAEIERDPARREYKEALSEKAKPFIPHEENANDLITLFSLMNVLGFAIGAGGKENAQTAMSAMNGMLEGHQKGREDLYKREKSIFETNQKQLDSRIKQLLAFMQDNELLSNMDKTARDQAIESEFLRNGATFMLEYYRKKGIAPTIELLEQNVKISEQVNKLTRDETNRAEDQAREDQKQADERKFKLDVAAQQEEKARARAREDRLFQISMKEQELAASEDRDKRNKTFESAMAVEKNRVELAMQQENHRHAEAQSDRVINHAQAIEIARIAREKALDEQHFKERTQDKADQAARDRATEVYRSIEQEFSRRAEIARIEHQKADDEHKKTMEKFERERIAIEAGKASRENQPTQFMRGDDGKMYQWSPDKRTWIPSPGLPETGVEKVGSGSGGRGSQTQQQFENITSADIGNAYFRINEYLSSSKDGKIPEGSKFLRDKGTQSGIIDAYKNYAINGMMPADLQKNDATLLGIAFDVVAARAFGRTSGVTDTKIAQVVRQLPVEGDNEATKQTKMRILLNQLEEPNKLLPETKRKDGAEYMKSPVARGLYRTYAEKAEAEVETGKDEKGSFHYEYNEDKTKRRKVYD